MSRSDPARRRFLAASGAALLVSACGTRGSNGGNAPVATTNAPTQPATGYPTKQGTLIGFGQAADSTRFIGTVDLDANRTVKMETDIDFLGHGFAPNPARPHLAVISQKHGKGCVEWDMKARRVTRKLATAPDREFYGHGAFTPDGRTLFLAESIVGDHSYRGVITIRDGDSYEIKGEFPSHGTAPHDTILVDDGATLVITNGGGHIDTDDLPCVTYVDVRTRELKRRLTFPTPRINAGHLAITARGELVVVSAPREGLDKTAPDFCGGISFYTPGGEMRTAKDPIGARMKSETLSVAIHEPTMIVAATNPAGHLVTFWDFRTGKLVKHLDQFKDPRGISVTLNRKYFALTYDTQTHAILIDATTLEPLGDTVVETTYISGSHNYVYDLGV
jgi:hypothetical protein